MRTGGTAAGTRARRHDRNAGHRRRRERSPAQPTGPAHGRPSLFHLDVHVLIKSDSWPLYAIIGNRIRLRYGRQQRFASQAVVTGLVWSGERTRRVG